MKKKLLHIMLGTMLVIGCYSNIGAEEVEVAYDEQLNSAYQEEKDLVCIEETSVLLDKTESTITEEEKAPSIEIQEVKVSRGEKVAEYAKQFIGTPYVSGGNDLNRGVDCSGFTQQVYKNFGVNLERRSSSQYASNGYAVSKSELKPGDLVFYGYSSVCHVAIYVGDNQIIHAPVPGQSVCIAPLWQNGDAPLIGYKRIFND